PAFAYEMVVIVQEGIRRMYELQENLFYYITAYNENYEMPAMPKKKGIEKGILAGAYHFQSTKSEKTSQVHLLGSGSIMQQVLNAKEKLEDMEFEVSVWSVTSYNELYREAEVCARQNRLHPFNKEKIPYIKKLFENTKGVYVAASDYMKALPNSIAPWMPDNFLILGTDGYGLSESRPDLRDYFEISADYICHAALVGLFRDGKVSSAELKKQLKKLKIDPEKVNPMNR
ncbi:MAG: pyruvate dehydrogenase (acetyl-transferring), homodimeric type, partial [Gammaproteobacteria bacterium]|nr:pyruvate dehydrogenase (acetyl-transferring), homodimeric type [Gammaproteobacteria bacterium]